MSTVPEINPAASLSKGLATLKHRKISARLEIEIATGKYGLKNMTTGEQESLDLESIKSKLK